MMVRSLSMRHLARTTLTRTNRTTRVVETRNEGRTGRCVKTRAGTLTYVSRVKGVATLDSRSRVGHSAQTFNNSKQAIDDLQCNARLWGIGGGTATVSVFCVCHADSSSARVGNLFARGVMVRSESRDPSRTSARSR